MNRVIISKIPDTTGILSTIYGRIFSKKIFGKLIFLNIQDMSGIIQLAIEKKTSPSLFKSIKTDINNWDVIKATGEVFYTDRGTKTLKLTKVEVLSKFGGYMIDKYHGIKDYRSVGRLQQIIAKRELFNTLIIRSDLYRKLRDFLHSENFLEFETPILLEEENTSKSSSFITHFDDKKIEYFLRKTPEQYLKKLIICGFEAVYEIGKDFRNENISKFFQPEFTVLELYKAYTSYKDMHELLFKILHHLESGLTQSRSLCLFEEYDFYDFIGKRHDHDKQLLAEKFINKVRKQKGRNLLIKHFPSWMSPLTKRNKDGLSEEFRYYVDGAILAHGNSELTDYNEQKKHFIMQAHQFSKHYDAESDTFLKSLKIGMPPFGGLGLGIDRLLLHYLQADNIRDILPFPK